MLIQNVPIGKNPPEEVNCIIEVPIGGEPIKYEMDKASGTLFVDRMLYTAMRYPGNYGFVPNTLAEDGAPLDAMVIMQEPTFAGCLIAALTYFPLFKALATAVNPALEAAIRAVHDYETPEIVKLDMADASRAYLDWIESVTR